MKPEVIMEELFDICSEYGQPTGKTVARSIAHRDGIMHRTAHIWIVREIEGRKQILLQKRSTNKDSFPGCLDTSSAGHIQAGDEPLDSARRELEEELGIHAEVASAVRAHDPQYCVPSGGLRMIGKYLGFEV